MTLNAASELLVRLHHELKIPADYASTTKLPFHHEVSLSSLVVAQLDDAGRPILLTKSASDAWNEMRLSASCDGIELLPFSGFRSYLYQRGLLANKVAAGVPIHEVLKILAAPGYSEHHTGEAVDITTVGCRQATEAFENTDAYAWLCAHAVTFGFRESYPRGNPNNLVFEPWHWKFTAR